MPTEVNDEEIMPYMELGQSDCHASISDTCVPGVGARPWLPELFAALVFFLGASSLPGETVATYQLDFTRLWTPETHPVDFPSNRHLSGLGGATHTSDVTFWEPGSLASLGVQRIAEQGRKGTLENIVNAAVASGTAGSYLSYGGISSSRVVRTETFQIRESFPLATIISMVAPSPDWFVGVSSVDLREFGDWTTSAHFDLFPYDAGTDSGITFNSANQPTVPPEPIQLLDTYPFEDTGPVATFDFQLLSVTEIGLAGDYDNNGQVDVADYLKWRDSLGAASTLPGDTTPGTVTAADYDAWKVAFGTAQNSSPPGTASGSALPEPASWVILLAGTAMMGRLRRRGRTRPGHYAPSLSISTRKSPARKLRPNNSR